MMRGDRKGVDGRGKGGEEGEWMGGNWNEVGDWKGKARRDESTNHTEVRS